MKTGLLTCLLALTSSGVLADSPSGFDDSIHIKFQPASSRPASSEPDRVEVPLTLKAMGSAEYHLGQISVPCSFNGNPSRCLLDTGAGVDVLFKGPAWANALATNGDKWDIRGGCDQSTLEADTVKVSDFRLGEARMGLSQFERLDRDHVKEAPYAGVVGMTTLSKASGFSLKTLGAPKLVLGSRGAGGGSFAVTSENQMILPIDLAGVVVPALFDTGASGSVVDLAYIRDPANAARFRLVPGSETSVGCATGTKTKVAAYQTSGLQIGNVSFPARQFVAYDFADLRKTLGVDVKMILGYDVISQLDWTFDWKSKTWGSSSGITIQTAENRLPPEALGFEADSAAASIYAR